MHSEYGKLIKEPVTSSFGCKTKEELVDGVRVTESP